MLLRPCLAWRPTATSSTRFDAAMAVRRWRSSSVSPSSSYISGTRLSDQIVTISGMVMRYVLAFLLWFEGRFTKTRGGFIIKMCPSG